MSEASSDSEGCWRCFVAWSRILSNQQKDARPYAWHLTPRTLDRFWLRAALRMIAKAGRCDHTAKGFNPATHSTSVAGPTTLSADSRRALMLRQEPNLAAVKRKLALLCLLIFAHTHGHALANAQCAGRNMMLVMLLYVTATSTSTRQVQFGLTIVFQRGGAASRRAIDNPHPVLTVPSLA